MKLKTTLCLLFLLISSGLSADNHRSESSEGASVSFANISEGDMLPNVFVVRFTISGMGIAPAGMDIENTGHHHLAINVQELPDFDQPLPANEKIRHFDKGETDIELKLKDGKYKLQLILADHSHTPHEPPIMSKPVTIVVSADAAAQAEISQD